MNNEQPGFFSWLQQHPMIIGLFVVVAIFGIIFLKKNNTTSTSTTGTTAAGDYSGLATDANGNPIIYRNVADEFVNVTKISGSYNSPVTSTSTSTATTTTNPPATNPAAPVEHPIEPHVIAPAKKGSLTVTNGAAGKKDTNFQIYTVGAGATLTSLAETAKWGTDAKKLANYRNNLTILKGAGVDTSNPLAPVPAGLKLSI